LKNGLLTFAVLAALACGATAVARKGQSTSESLPVMAAVAPATYPAIARQANAHGEVIIEVQVDTGGNVESAKVISGHPLFQRVSEVAARQWKFSSDERASKARIVRLTFAYREVNKSPTPKLHEFTTVFLPPYKVEIQVHPGMPIE
jgi:TonB family protein